MNFFPKTPEISLRRISFQFSVEVIVGIHEKLEKFQNISIEDFLETVYIIAKLFIRIYKSRNREAFKRYASCR
jgi:hypothetical protein